MSDGLREYLAQRDTACPGCGYNLRGLPGDRCPECNQHLQISVSLAEPRTGALIAAVVTLAIGAGAAGVWLFFIVVFTIYYRDAPPAWFLAVPILTVLVEGTLLTALVRKQGRTWFRSLGDRARLKVVAGCIGLTVIAALAYLVHLMQII